MKAIQVKYVRTLIRVRLWANTEKGERVLCAIGAIWAVLAWCSFVLLAMGVLLNYVNVEL